jgi:hypothetical protein
VRSQESKTNEVMFNNHYKQSQFKTWTKLIQQHYNHDEIF